MNTTSIPLGTAARLTPLYSFPNFPGDKRSLAQTIEHWFGMTLDRDGLTAQGATAKVRITGDNYFLDLTGPDALAASFKQYAVRLPQFLINGETAFNTVVPQLKAQNKWDPCPDKSAAVYHPWRTFLPHGMAMLNQKALLFFHYPPIRLLDVNQDYLDDPVPVRCEELLAANGVSSASPYNLASGDIMLFNTVMDATPIGAEDDQGSKNPDQCKADGCPATAYDPTFGLIPIQYFHDYQKAQVSLLLNPSTTKPGYTQPIVVYGNHPLQTFNALYGTKIKNYAPAVVAEIIPGMKTPVLASSHPYVFYGQAQGFDKIGSGVMPAGNVPQATKQMQLDLAVAGWLKAMSDDPSQDVTAVWNTQKAQWTGAAKAPTVSALVQHQGSLFYKDPTTLAFTFNIPLVWPTPPQAVKAAAPKLSSGAGLQVIGDSGTPVDWWFIYKISKESESPTNQTATGQEYLYFDSEMAAKAGSKPVLSSNLIDKSGALFDTFSQLFTPAAKTNKDLGWYCYNDEDRYEPGTTEGTGPSPCGHCKGALAFDLATDSAFWLIHSVPLLPMNAAFVYPPTGFKMAQTMLCIQLPNADASKSIAQLMYDAHGPNVHVASDMLTTAVQKENNFSNPPVTNVPKKLGNTDPRVLLMQNKNGSSGSKPAPYSGQIPFSSKGGQKFLAIAKNRAWGDPALGQPVKDFYDVLVSTALNENIDVETWENVGPKIPPEQEAGETHDVENMKSVNLAPLGIPWSWAEQNDHAKLAISDRNNPPGSDHWVCVGDINFTDSMEKRGGGTVGFICEPLWQALSLALSTTPEPGSKSKPASKGTDKNTKPAVSAKATPAVAVKAAPKKAAPKKAAPKKVAPKKVAPKKGAPKKVAPKKAAPKKAAPKKVAPKKAAPKKAAPKKVAPKKAAPKKAAPKKAAPKKVAPKKVAPKKKPRR